MADVRRFFDEIEVGEESESPGRTVTEADIVLFAGLSGDYNILHTDAEFMKSSIFGERIAHGLLGLAIQSGLFTRAGMPYATLGFGDAAVEVQGADQDRRHDPRAGQGHRQEGRRQDRSRRDHRRAPGAQPARRGGAGGRDRARGGAPARRPERAMASPHQFYFEDMRAARRARHAGHDDHRGARRPLRRAQPGSCRAAWSGARAAAAVPDAPASAGA